MDVPHEVMVKHYDEGTRINAVLRESGSLRGPKAVQFIFDVEVVYLLIGNPFDEVPNAVGPLYVVSRKYEASIVFQFLVCAAIRPGMLTKVSRNFEIGDVEEPEGAVASGPIPSTYILHCNLFLGSSVHTGSDSLGVLG